MEVWAEKAHKETFGGSGKPSLQSVWGIVGISHSEDVQVELSEGTQFIICKL